MQDLVQSVVPPPQVSVQDDTAVHPDQSPSTIDKYSLVKKKEYSWKDRSHGCRAPWTLRYSGPTVVPCRMKPIDKGRAAAKMARLLMTRYIVRWYIVRSVFVYFACQRISGMCDGVGAIRTDYASRRNLH